MKIQKLLKSNEFMFFLVALVLFGFAINTLGKQKNNILEGLGEDLGSVLGDGEWVDNGNSSGANNVFGVPAAGVPEAGVSAAGVPAAGDSDTDDDTDDESDDVLESVDGGIMGSSSNDSVADMGTNVPDTGDTKSPTNPSDLLPNKDKKLPNMGAMIPIQEPNIRNANLQVRSDPPVGKTDSGPWNQTTIEPDKTRKQFEVGTLSGEGDVAGWTRPCSFWMSNDISKESQPLIQSGQFLTGTGNTPGQPVAATGPAECSPATTDPAAGLVPPN